MSSAPTRARIARGLLVVLALLFLPLACWFAWTNWRRYGMDALALAAVSVLFLRLALDRRPESWMTWLDDSGGPANPDAHDD